MPQSFHLVNGDVNTTSSTMWLEEVSEINVKAITSTVNISQGCAVYQAPF